MAERKRINIVYRYDGDWIAGSYYILNIIKALKLLEDAEKPFLQILHTTESPIDVIRETGYPYLSFKEVELKVNLAARVLNRFFYFLNGHRIFNLRLANDINANVYPLYPGIQDTGIENAYYWIPDFQERYYPAFFSKNEIRARRLMHNDLLKHNSRIVFSSKNALNDFNTFYPTNKNIKKVLNFASFIGDDYKKIQQTDLLKKFNISKPYFIIPNQFWMHKNHKTVLEAIVLLKEKVLDFQFVFTGKETDYKNPDYADQLKAYVKANGATEDVLFLGFIDRNEQLKLMSEAIAIIQPSLFEGWSTVVEDAKVINKTIIVSDIPLHREQIQENCLFFDPKNPTDLAMKIKSINPLNIGTIDIDYEKSQRKFARDFINLFDGNQ